MPAFRLPPPRLAAAAAALSLALGAARSAQAWPADEHVAIAIQSARLMPVSLQRVLADNISRLKEGATAPLKLATSESAVLHAGGSAGTLDKAIMAETQRILDLLQKRAPLSNVSYEMGVLSCYMAWAHDPLNLAADDPRAGEWAPEFERYAGVHVPEFTVTLDTYLSPKLEHDDVLGFVHDVADRSRGHYAILSESFVKPDGSLASTSTFDQRHPVFGVAALGYSRSISDTAKLWLYIWIRSNGDTSGLPFPQAFDEAAMQSPSSGAPDSGPAGAGTGRSGTSAGGAGAP